MRLARAASSSITAVSEATHSTAPAGRPDSVPAEQLEQARVATSQDERAELYKQMQSIVHEDAPWVFVANWKQNAVTGANVEGFKLQPSFFLMLQDVSKQ